MIVEYFVNFMPNRTLMYLPSFLQLIKDGLARIRDLSTVATKLEARFGQKSRSVSAESATFLFGF